ncbi:uncharacterized protein LOC124341405 [Daphnia pulicaria]|uniref:uncharacterized protein LOC124341405 n=1 Tax=Daphnia pulicaria TaxID=35523 RepID=UPI001EEABC16|nr:uncharacterized protein LOC124341405 [Daphnia pulicaria]
MLEMEIPLLNCCRNLDATKSELHGCSIINVVLLQPAGERCDQVMVELQLLRAVYRAGAIPSVTAGKLLELSLVLMLSWSVGESHALSLLVSAISELTLDHAALWLPKCWTSNRTAKRLLEMVYVYVAVMLLSNMACLNW